jgi:hypothetical protein
MPWWEFEPEKKYPFVPQERELDCAKPCPVGRHFIALESFAASEAFERGPMCASTRSPCAS